MEIKNLSAVAERIKLAGENNERIILYGDGDLDGISSLLIMKEALKNLSIEPAAIYFPDREAEGYGLTPTAISQFEKLAPALIVVMDMGISNFDEIALANKKGFEVILIDHHQVLGGKLPPASLIVDPKQEGETYPFQGFAACGLTFRVAERMLGERMTPALRKSLVELAALGTIADMMPREQDNVEIIEEGLSSIAHSWRPGLDAFFEFVPLKDFVSLEDRVSQIISILNVRDIEDGLPGAYRVLSAATKEEADRLVQHLWKMNKVRQDNIRAFVEDVEDRVMRHDDDSIIFEGTKNLDYVLLGSAASILSNRHDKPVFLYKEKAEESIGSARAPSGYDTVKAMSTCKDLLISYGGHAPASGFRFKNENKEEFQKCLFQYFKDNK